MLYLNLIFSIHFWARSIIVSLSYSTLKSLYKSINSMVEVAGIEPVSRDFCDP